MISILEKDPKKRVFPFSHSRELKVVSKALVFEVLHRITIPSKLESGFRQFWLKRKGKETSTTTCCGQTFFAFQSGRHSNEVCAGFSGCRKAFHLIRLGMLSKRVGWLRAWEPVQLGVAPVKPVGAQLWAGHEFWEEEFPEQACSSPSLPPPHPGALGSRMLQAAQVPSWDCGRGPFCDVVGNSSKQGKISVPPSTPWFACFDRTHFSEHYVKNVYKLGNTSLAKCIFPGFYVNIKAKQPDPSFTSPPNKVNKAPTEMVFANTGIAEMMAPCQRKEGRTRQVVRFGWNQSSLCLRIFLTYFPPGRNSLFPQVLNEVMAIGYLHLWVICFHLITNWLNSPWLGTGKPEREERETREEEISTCTGQNLLLTLWDQSGPDGAWDFILPAEKRGPWRKEGGVRGRGQQKPWSAGQREKMWNPLRRSGKHPTGKSQPPRCFYPRPGLEASFLIQKKVRGSQDQHQNPSVSGTPAVEKVSPTSASSTGSSNTHHGQDSRQHALLSVAQPEKQWGPCLQPPPPQRGRPYHMTDRGATM